MDYRELNKLHLRKMKNITREDFQMEWEDPEYLNTLMGELPSIRYTPVDNGIKSEIKALQRLLKSYCAFSTNRDSFVQKVNEAIENIRTKEKNWYGLSIHEVKESVRQHEFCLISGEGGVGKSYFIMCLEEKLTNKGIPHLCLYGKFQKDIKNIDKEEIISNCSEGFVFIVDAINEMSDSGQEEMLQLLKEFKKHRSIRIIVTYRTYSLDNTILEEYRNISSAEYEFPGVSYDSALEILLRSAVPDVYKYEDILYSNNALLLKMLCVILKHEKLFYEKVNSICSFTFILEQYIISFGNENFNGSCKGIDIWNDTKKVAEWMYHQESKSIDVQTLPSIVDTENYLEVMTQSGFMGTYEYDDQIYVGFLIDSLADFLIARSMFNEISKKTFEEQVEVIKEKMGKLYITEAITLVIFDNLSPDYEYIIDLLEATQLSESIEYRTLIKINFNRDSIEKFLEVFKPSEPSNLIRTFGGYTDKPFNCTNYLNEYYKNKKHQNISLSVALSGNHFLESIKGRLKNILYFITQNNRPDRRDEEAFYFALWCCAAPNRDVRSLAMKLLYEISIRDQEYQEKLLEEYEHLADYYVKEAVICVLANCQQNDSKICNFFRNIIVEEEHLTAKSIKRIATYLNKPYGYIYWDRENLYNYSPDAVISDFMHNLLFKVDLMAKNYLPFRYHRKNNINIYPKFLSRDKTYIHSINNKLQRKYACVKKEGDCSGHMNLENHIKDEMGDERGFDCLDIDSFFCSYESVITYVFDLYQVDVDEKVNLYEQDFNDSVFQKSLDVATGIYYGSLMCNFYTKQLAIYNNHQNSIGYEVYDPFEDGEEIYVASPIPTHQSLIEKLGDTLLMNLEIPSEKDLRWVNDVTMTRKNILSFLNPVVIKNVKWVMLAGSISVQENDKYNTKWKDSYNVWACTSDRETLRDDGEEKHLTISLDNYVGNLSEYGNSSLKPWLCKTIKSIKHGSNMFDDTFLVMPPAEIISYFQLQPNFVNMSWVNSANEEVILCNNNKHSYYKEPVGGSVFIKKAYLDKFLADKTLKYFAFTERYIPKTGYDNAASLHLEIQDGRIAKEIPNSGN